MGCSESKSEYQREEEKENKKVEQFLKKEKYAYMAEIKLLLLGTGESGKSTIAKQMRILHTEGFSQKELMNYRSVVFSNCIGSMKAIVAFALKSNLPILEENRQRVEFFNENSGTAIDMADQFNEQVAKDLAVLWKDPGIRESYEKRTDYQLPDSAEYCLDNVIRFAEPDYVPTITDVLRVRARTTGIIETKFKVKDSNFRMVDVGGQRSERKKWIHCFQEVTAIIYTAALSEYDMKLFEDESVNRMEESLELFEEICNSKWFTKTAMILFLNKFDLFQEKIKKVDLKILFEEYEGGCNEGPALEFIQDKFLSLNKNANRKIFVHPTCATDTEQVKVVFDAAKEIIISQNLERLGFGQL
eukprot:TRINITY_DN2289_c0_g1_i1.p1 TRINITY_DN2289_c0_g1~~TRINITY_DN2289_c0_g1_i1.p1  ORF type:complete len:359 (-),score=129.09 TRINITY_DN2289_c0_g1_i1:7-1083(-)